MKRISRPVKILISVALLVYVFRTNGIQLEALTLAGLRAPAWLLLAGALVLVANPFLGASRWKIFLTYVGVEERRLELVRFFFLSAFFGLLLPSTVGPDAVRMYLIEKKHTAHRGRTSATVLGERVLGFLLLCTFGFVGAVWLGDRYAGKGLVWVMGGLVLCLLGIVAVLKSPRTSGVVEAVLSALRVPKGLSGFLFAMSDALARLPLGKVLPRALPFMVLFQLSIIAVVWVLFLAFGVHLPFHLHLAFVPVITIISILPASVGGFGLREGAFVHFYGLAGVAPDTAFSVSILFFIVTLGSSAFFGGLWALAGNVTRKDLAGVEGGVPLPEA